MLHVICGAPCSGKTTYVREHASENALVIDADKIANAFGGSEYHATGEPLKVALDAREVAIRHALKSDSESWLIDSNPSDERLREYAEADAEIILISTPFDECMKRASNRPEGTGEIITKWFNNESNLRNKIYSIGGKLMETVKQEVTEERTFTQSELDAIVADRLKRDRAKYADYEQLKGKAEEYDRLSEASKSELQKAVEARDALQKELDDLKSAAAIREIRAKVSEETGIPMSLITAATEEDCKAQAQAILSFTQAQGYPAVKDAGEVVTGGKQTTKQQFAAWANEAFN